MIETVPVASSRRSLAALDDRLVAVAVAGAAAGAAWLRLPRAVRDVVWAEDGARFLTELTREGFWPTLFKPYTGYLQFWPRVLTEIAAQAGLVHFAELISVVACLAVGAIGGGVYLWSRAVVSSAFVRLGLAVAPVLVPMAPIEVLGNVANLHWFVLWASIWLMLKEPTTKGGALALAALAASFALTEIQVAVVVPLLVVHRGSRNAWIVRGGLLAGLFVQIVSTLLAPRVTMADHLGFDSIVAGYFVNGPLAVLVGDQARAGALLADHGIGVAIAAFVPFVACATYAIVRGRPLVRAVVVTLLLTSAATWFAALWMNVSSAFVPMFGYAVFSPGQFRSMSYYRYGFVPGLCLLGVVLVASGVMLARARGSSSSAVRRRATGAALLVGLGLVFTHSFSAPKTLRDGQPSWEPSYVAARAVCLAHPRLMSAQVAEAPATWAADLPCSVLR